MKPLQLTIKQKKNLIEMCSKLFHEYSEPYFITKLNSTSTMVFQNDKEIIYIHWYEFCLLQLAPKLIKILPAGKFVCTIGSYSGITHPVDTMYKIFKNIC